MLKINKVNKARLLFWCIIIAIIVYVIVDIDRQRSGQADVGAEESLNGKDFKVIGNKIVEIEYKTEEQFLEKHRKKLERDRKEKQEAEEERLARVEKETKRRAEVAAKIKKEQEERTRLANAEVEKKKSTETQVVAKAEQPNRGGGRKYRIETLTVTAYAPYDNQSGICNDGNPNKTSTGSKPAHGTVAVNPKRFSYGTEFYIEGYGSGYAKDTGGAMRQNSSKIDVFVQTAKQARDWGVRKIEVRIYEK